MAVRPSTAAAIGRSSEAYQLPNTGIIEHFWGDEKYAPVVSSSGTAYENSNFSPI